ncbi:K(+)-transporting ATPase subunit F [Streptomyces sp. MS19]
MSAGTAESVAGLVVAVALLGYLVAALLFPERF